MSLIKVASEFMTRELVTLSPETNVIDAIDRLVEANISGAPVVNHDGQYLGVFSEKCSLAALTQASHVAEEAGHKILLTRDFMTTNLTTVEPTRNVFDAIDDLLAARISGAPVVDGEGKFMGVFSEKTAMRALVAATYDHLPGTDAVSYMNTDRRRVIRREETLLDVATRFLETPFRRLPVLDDEQLVGQVSRRDVIHAELRLSQELVRSAKGAEGQNLQRTAGTLASVREFMDCNAKTISETDDLLAIAQIFLNTPYRRLPVLNNGCVVGQVSRRDVLAVANGLLRKPVRVEPAKGLYLSQVATARPRAIQ